MKAKTRKAAGKASLDPLVVRLHCCRCDATLPDHAFFPPWAATPEKRIGIQPECPVCRSNNIELTHNARNQGLAPQGERND